MDVGHTLINIWKDGEDKGRVYFSTNRKEAALSMLYLKFSASLFLVISQEAACQKTIFAKHFE